MLNFIDIIVSYGAPKINDSQCSKHNQKYLSKKPGPRFCKINNTSGFECQVTTKISEAMIIDGLYHTINYSINNEKNTTKINGIEKNIIVQFTKNTEV